LIGVPEVNRMSSHNMPHAGQVSVLFCGEALRISIICNFATARTV
jgi:hypothetical protein